MRRDFTKNGIRFDIESLGPVRDSVIDFRPFLLFSGFSNTGKSYTAMAVYFLMVLLDDEKLMTGLTEKLFPLDYKKLEEQLKKQKKVELDIPETFLEELGGVYRANIGRFMGYMLGYEGFSCSVSLKIPAGAVPSTLSLHLKNSKNGSGTDYPRIEIRATHGQLTMGRSGLDFDIKKNLVSFVEDLCKEVIFGASDFLEFFLPPARGALSGLTVSSLQELSGIGMYREFIKKLDHIRFGDFYSWADQEREDRDKKKILDPLLKTLIGGKITIERDNTFFTIPGSRSKMPLSSGSSSMKELYPLYLILKRVPFDRLSLCIEEPEAHLHLELQRAAALILSYIVNRGGYVQATTHSDFFVNQVNNLLKLHHIKGMSEERFRDSLKKTGLREDFILDPGNVGAYYFEKTGDGVRARRLDASDKGFPMKSFESVYEKSVEETRTLREALADDD